MQTMASKEPMIREQALHVAAVQNARSCESKHTDFEIAAEMFVASTEALKEASGPGRGRHGDTYVCGCRGRGRGNRQSCACFFLTFVTQCFLGFGFHLALVKLLDIGT
jgi:hypothetical protein